MDPKELREIAERIDLDIYNDGDLGRISSGLRQAADEIEKLRIERDINALKCDEARAELEQSKADHHDFMRLEFETRCALNRAKADIERLQGNATAAEAARRSDNKYLLGEIERLRAALEWYADPQSYFGSAQVLARAREALQNQPPNRRGSDGPERTKEIGKALLDWKHEDWSKKNL